MAPEGGALVLDGIVKRYGTFTLGPLTATFRRGRRYGLLGPNAAGKTTLLGCIAGQVRPNEGSIRWKGRVLHWGDWQSRADMAFIAENPCFYDEFSVAGNLRFGAEVYPHWDEAFAARWCERLKLDLRRRFGDLSRGTKVKVALIAGLAHRSDLLLLDEPTSGLDPDARAETQDLLRELGAADALLVISSHLFEDIESVANEVKIIREGHIVFEGPLARLSDMMVLRRSTGPVLSWASVIGRWRSRGEEWLLIDAAVARDLDSERLIASALEHRPATLRDLYFAFGRDA
jgi:ABC-2 type transport system ATP-binding protein